MKRKTLISLCLAGTLLLSSCSSATPSGSSASGTSSSDAGSSSLTEELDSSGAPFEINEFHSLTLETVSANVRIVSGDAWTMDYTLWGATAWYMADNPDGHLQLLGLDAKQQYVPKSESLFITITVPEGTELSDIRINSLYGNIEVENITCHSLSLSSNSGDIRMDGIVAEDMDLNAPFGSIDGTNLSVSTAEVVSSLGPTNLNGSFGTLDTISLGGKTTINGSIATQGTMTSTAGHIEVSLSHPVGWTVEHAGTLNCNGTSEKAPFQTEGSPSVVIKSTSGDVILTDNAS